MACDAITGQVIEVDPYDFLSNQRLVNDSFMTLVGPHSTDLRGRIATDDYDVSAGQTVNLSLQIDIDANMPEGYLIQGGVRYSDGGGLGSDTYFYDVEVADYLLVDDVDGSMDIMVGPEIRISN